jgi:DNA-binding NtrC family response regulator
MRVALDATPLSLATGGISRYTRELCRALGETFPEDEYWLVSDQEFSAGTDLPGNVRQLRNVVERVLCNVDGDIVLPVDLPDEAFDEGAAGDSFAEKVAALEKRLIADALQKANGSQKAAAARLGMTYDQYRHYYKKYDFNKRGA